jgi:hypothetical protein
VEQKTERVDIGLDGCDVAGQDGILHVHRDIMGAQPTSRSLRIDEGWTHGENRHVNPDAEDATMPPPTPDAAKPASRRASPEPAAWQDDPRSVQILSAEHASLASTRSLVYNEAFTRVGVFLTFMSMSFVALALVSQATGFGGPFLGIAAVVLSFDLVIGLMTFGRILGTTADDLRAVHGMTRIRHGFLQIRPQLRPYFTAGAHDDIPGVMRAYRTPGTGIGGVLYSLTTSTGMVAVIDALVAGMLAAVLAMLIGANGPAAAVVGVVAAVLVFGAVAVLAARFFMRDQASLEVLFPSPGPEDRIDG